MFPPEIQYIISNYKIFGFIPLDKVLHLAVGVGLTVFLRVFGVRPLIVLGIVFALAIGKEIVDSFVLNNTFEEHVMDTLITVVYPVILFLAMKIKSKAERS